MSLDRTESTDTVNTLHQSNDDSDASQRRDDSRPTPLPKAQLFIVLFMQVAEPVTSTVIYPFVNQLVKELHITDDERKTGYYVGLIVSRPALSCLFYHNYVIAGIHILCCRGSHRSQLGSCV